MVWDSPRCPFSSAGRYRQWEKSRRERFNHLLLELASSLPDFADDHAAPRERGNTALKWSKAEVLERARRYIRALEELKVAGEVARRVRAVRKQNKSVNILYS